MTENLKAQDLVTHANKGPYSSQNFYQESYLLYNEKETQLFLHNTKGRDKDLWILKPTGLSKGRGVKIIKDLRAIKESMGITSSWG